MHSPNLHHRCRHQKNPANMQADPSFQRNGDRSSIAINFANENDELARD